MFEDEDHVIALTLMPYMPREGALLTIQQRYAMMMLKSCYALR